MLELLKIVNCAKAIDDIIRNKKAQQKPEVVMELCGCRREMDASGVSSVPPARREMKGSILDAILGELGIQALQQGSPRLVVDAGSPACFHQPLILFALIALWVFVWNPPGIMTIDDFVKLSNRIFHGLFKTPGLRVSIFMCSE